MQKLRPLLFFLGLAAALTACSGASNRDAPAAAVETYLQAKVSGDADTVRALLCSEKEQYLERETQTFATVSNASIENMACIYTGDGRVACEGTITALYGTEKTEFPLTNYRVVSEDGDWKWCGETE